MDLKKFENRCDVCDYLEIFWDISVVGTAFFVVVKTDSVFYQVQ